MGVPGRRGDMQAYPGLRRSLEQHFELRPLESTKQFAKTLTLNISEKCLTGIDPSKALLSDQKTCRTMSSAGKQKDDCLELSSDSDQKKIIEISSTDDEGTHSSYENYRAQRSLKVLKPRSIRKAAQLAQKRWREVQLKTQAVTSEGEEDSEGEENTGLIEFKQGHSKLPSRDSGLIEFKQGHSKLPSRDRGMIEFKQSHSKLPSRNRGDGKSCHPCRKNLSNHSAQCSQCDRKFCQRCLRVRHGENVFEVSKPELQWVCPKCRTGCGAGCVACCCTCSVCCRANGTQPRDRGGAKKVIKDAQSAGFNLHDFLIHLETRESKEEIAKRKRCWVWAKASSKCTSSEVAELENDDVSAEQKSGFNVKREDFTPPDDVGHNGKMRQIKTNEFDVAFYEKEIHQEKCNIDDDPGQVDAKEEYGTNKTLNDCAVAIDDVEERLYFMQLLWSCRKIESIGDKWSITLRDKDVQLRNAIKARSPANGIAHIFNSKNFKNQSQDDKEWMKKSLKDSLRNHLVECNRRATDILGDVESQLTSIVENVEKAVDVIPSHNEDKILPPGRQVAQGSGPCQAQQTALTHFLATM